METLQFESVKIAMKQDKEGLVLTLRIHPDDAPVALMRDFVGARYQTVMVRLSDEDRPLNREVFRDPVKIAAILCKDKDFAQWLVQSGKIFDESEEMVIDWIKETLNIQSRSELKNPDIAKKFWLIEQEYKAWKSA